MARPKHVVMRVGQQGRLVLPADIRRRLGIDVGDEVVAEVEDERLVIESRDAVLRRMQRRWREADGSESPVDELIAERREEARREQAELP